MLLQIPCHSVYCTAYIRIANGNEIVFPSLGRSCLLLPWHQGDHHLGDLLLDVAVLGLFVVLGYTAMFLLRDCVIRFVTAKPAQPPTLPGSYRAALLDSTPEGRTPEPALGSLLMATLRANAGTVWSSAALTGSSSLSLVDFHLNSPDVTCNCADAIV